MNKSIKYFKKRTQLKKIIQEMSIIYEDDDSRMAINPNWDDAEKCAEKILAKLGYHKPKNKIK